MDKIEIMKQMLNISPHSGKIWYLLGLEYKEQQLCGEAIGAFSQALTHLEAEERHLAYYELHTLSNENQNLKKIATFQNSGKIPVQTPTLLLDHLIGHETLKKYLRKNIIEPFSNRSHRNLIKKRVCHTLLLYGPSGCGKNQIAEAIAGECHAGFISVMAPDHISPYQDMNTGNLKEIFETARNNTPCVLFFDKIDEIIFQDKQFRSNAAALIKKQLLEEIRHVETGSEPILFIPSTSRPWNIDPELKQLGRTELSQFISPPDHRTRSLLLSKKLGGKYTEDIHFDELAAKMELYTETDIDTVVELAAEYVIMDYFETAQERPISTHDLLQAVAATAPSALDWIKTAKNFIPYTNLTGFYDDVKIYLEKYQKLL